MQETKKEPIELTRKKISEVFKNQINTNAHSGLLLQKGLIRSEDGQKDIKNKLIDHIANLECSNLYKLGFNRWLLATPNNDNQNNGNSIFKSFVATLVNRFFSNLASGGILETGFSINHTYGMPFISGSSIKGAVRAYFRNILGDIKEYKLYETELFGADEKEGAISGGIIWHDAWWVPNSLEDKPIPFVKEIVTVHHQEYYTQNKEIADEMESPIPNLQIAVQGSFYFVIEAKKSEGANEWADFAVRLLKKMLENQGMGSKTTSGYGYFNNICESDKLYTKIKDELEKEKKEAENRQLEHQREIEKEQLKNSGDIEKYIEAEIKDMKEEDLIINFSKKLNSFFNKVELNKEKSEDKQLVCNIAYKFHQQTIDTWEKSTKTNEQKAYKFIMKNKEVK